MAKKLTRSELNTKVLGFFAKNPNPKDIDVHAFAGRIGVDVPKVEEAIYRALTSRIKK